MWVVVGLGNPGAEYAATRHNLGWMVVDALLQQAHVRARRTGDMMAATVDLDGVAVALVKPTTYVNRSGCAVQQARARWGFEPGELLVVLDDVYLPFGRLRLRPEGSSGGHNGLRSIETALATRAYPRLRLGVGSPERGTGLADHVLESFTPEEQAGLPAFVASGAAAVGRVLREGVLRAMPGVNAPPSA